MNMHIFWHTSQNFFVDNIKFLFSLLSWLKSCLKILLKQFIDNYILQIRVTFLKVHPTGMQKIQNTPVNRPGSMKLNDGEYPEFYYSRRYNFLKRHDCKDLFKALLLIKMMEVRREAARKS